MRYEGLKVYQKSYELALKMYKFAKGLPREEEYGLSSQLRCASISIPLNIAEGYGKQGSEAEYRRYLSMAKGSCNEVEVLLSFLKDLGYMERNQYEQWRGAYEEVERMLYGIMKSAKG